MRNPNEQKAASLLAAGLSPKSRPQHHPVSNRETAIDWGWPAR
jgi:hypothetical protein